VPVAETVPITGFILTVVAFAVLHERVEEPSSIMEAGLAVKYSIVGRINSGVTGLVGASSLQPRIDKDKYRHKKHKSIFLTI